MTSELTDKTGAAVTVTRNDAKGAYEIADAEGAEAGRAYFYDLDGDRIFFHTEVDDAYAGRGLAAVLVRTALDETRADGLTAVPVCPYVAGFLKKNEQEYDGAFRAVRPADLEHVQERQRS